MARKTVLYKVAGFVLTNDDVARLAARIRGEDDRFFLDMDISKRNNDMEGALVALNAEAHKAAIDFWVVTWPDDHPREKFGLQRMAIVRTEPSLTETPEDFKQVPLEADEDEDDRMAVKWLKKYKYSDEEIAEMWMTVPRQWIHALEVYPLIPFKR